MNWDRIEGNWKQITGHAKARWAKLTDDDMNVVAGKREALAGKIQERYGVARDEAEEQLSRWQRKANEAWFGLTHTSAQTQAHALAQAQDEVDSERVALDALPVSEAPVPRPAPRPTPRL